MVKIALSLVLIVAVLAPAFALSSDRLLAPHRVDDAQDSVEVERELKKGDSRVPPPPLATKQNKKKALQEMPLQPPYESDEAEEGWRVPINGASADNKKKALAAEEKKPAGPGPNKLGKPVKSDSDESDEEEDENEETDRKDKKPVNANKKASSAKKL